MSSTPTTSLRRAARTALAIAAALAVLAVGARETEAATPQLVRGKKLLLKDPGDAARRKIVALAVERDSDDSLSDPTVNGATLRVVAHGGTDSDQVFFLPKQGWRPLGTVGYRFSNRKLAGVTVRSVVLKRTAGRTFTIRALVLGKDGPVAVVPPNPGDDGGLVLTVTGGATYCVGFGGVAGGKESKDDARQWLIVKPHFDACPVPLDGATPTPAATASPTLGPTATATGPTASATPVATVTPDPNATPTATPTPSLPSCGEPPPSDPLLVPDDDPFYQPPDPIPADPPGTLIRSRRVALSAVATDTPFQAWQLMFVSTDAHGERSAAIATLLLPCTDATTSPRPIVSYQTAEDSCSQLCAPSFRLRNGNEKEAVSLPPLLAQGWAVVVPDYEGLESAYTVGIQASHGVLDALRAAVTFPDAGLAGLGTPIGMWGYSGGGLATTWAAESAPVYAPELNLVAVSAGGVPPDITSVADHINGGAFSAILLAGTVGMGQAYPELQALSNANGLAARDYFLQTCIEQYLVSQYAFQNVDDYTTVPGAIHLPWVQEILALNHLGNVCSTFPYQHCLADGECDDGGVCRRKHPTVPMYVFHALNDELIPILDTNQLVEQYCEAGVVVQYYQDPASDHNSLAVSGAPAAIAHLIAGFGGQPPLDTCGLPILPPPPPLATPTPGNPNPTPTPFVPFNDCGGSPFPTCDGSGCPAGHECAIVFGDPLGSDGGCACVPTAAGEHGCGSVPPGSCPANPVCPPGTTCFVNVYFGGGCGCFQCSGPFCP